MQALQWAGTNPGWNVIIIFEIWIKQIELSRIFSSLFVWTSQTIVFLFKTHWIYFLLLDSSLISPLHISNPINDIDIRHYDETHNIRAYKLLQALLEFHWSTHTHTPVHEWCFEPVHLFTTDKMNASVGSNQQKWVCFIQNNPGNASKRHATSAQYFRFSLPKSAKCVDSFRSRVYVSVNVKCCCVRDRLRCYFHRQYSVWLA